MGVFQLSDCQGKGEASMRITVQMDASQVEATVEDPAALTGVDALRLAVQALLGVGYGAGTMGDALIELAEGVENAEGSTYP